jgi:lactaldehyde dehydrogenase / glycolaldehyde dehydrogenase
MARDGKLVALVEENAETLAQTLTAEGGKLISESRIDVQFCAQLLSYAADSARRLQGEILPGEGPSEQIWIQRAPFGVVAGIPPGTSPPPRSPAKSGPPSSPGTPSSSSRMN